MRPSIWVSAISWGSWPWAALKTEILTELDPALMERMILDIVIEALLAKQLRMLGERALSERER